MPELPAGLTLDDGVVALRPWRAADAPALATVCGDPDVCRFSTVPWAYTRAAAEGWVARQEAKRLAGIGLSLAVTRVGEDVALGNVSLHGVGGGVATLGYWLVPAARGRGLATAAARLASGWALARPGTERVELPILPGNLASRRVAERLGAVSEGLRVGSHIAEGRAWDTVVYVLEPGPWRS